MDSRGAIAGENNTLKRLQIENTINATWSDGLKCTKKTSRKL